MWRSLVLLAVVTASLRATPTIAQSAAHAPSRLVPRDTFDAWMSRVSNARRWGADDELGTLNLITPRKRRAAANDVRDGVTISLARELVSGPNPNAFMPVRFGMIVNGLDSLATAAVDTFSVLAHGYAYTHIDALSHFAVRGRLYNGYSSDALEPSGARRLGIEHLRGGIVTRGVLVDMPRLRNVPYLPSGSTVTIADLEEWERVFRVRIEPGDVLLIRTGRDPRAAQHGSWQIADDASGPEPEVALWLHARGVAAMGSDVANERSPSLVSGVVTPVHLLTIVSMGMPLFDNLDLERLAERTASARRPTFLFMASPLPMRGGSGSLVNPLAMF